MRPIRLKLNLIILALGIVALAMFLLGRNFYSKFEVNQQGILQVIEARDLLEDIPDATRNEKNIQRLSSFSQDLYPEQRQKRFDEIVEAFKKGRKGDLRDSIKNFLHADKVHYKNMKAQLEYLEQKFVFYSLALLSTLGILLFGLRVFLGVQIFSPLHTTTKRIEDFLNGKYSYNFDSPPENEMGELQTTFNSMAQEVLKNMEELKALDAAKSDFLNIASHELRTPMTSIKGSLSLISTGIMGEVSSEVLNLIKIAELETDRLVRLINDILDIAKIDAKKLPLKLEWIRLHDLVDKTVSSLQGLASTFDVSIEKHSFHDVELQIDADRIQQVITNLISNAVKFSPKSNKVEIIVDIEAGKPVCIKVRDHGKGMTPQEKSILFQKFRQISSPDNPLVKGTGLGLAIAKALVEEHGGIIDVHTKPQDGCTFYFTIPEWRLTSTETKETAA